ncbi:MAG: TIGR03960 family B12-binding radical SAM protein [Myxococcales bacterium]|nr:MAG: TIGR03960 family B12-binding radical SAM protein [Myxococcales bacterium]
MAQKTTEHPYADFLPKVMKPARYVGGEHGEILKDFDAAACTICLAFPDLYDIGMSHLGYKILYSIINKHPKLLAERSYAPWLDMEQELRLRDEPLRSLESWRPLSDFDIVGFSLQFELTYSNVLLMLELGGIPLRSDERNNDDPLIVAGGPCATHAEPMSSFIDVFLIGDGEEATPELMLTWSALKKTKMTRVERLRALAKLPGLYVPSLYQSETMEDTGLQVVQKPDDPSLPYPIERSFVKDISKYPFPSDGPIAATETVFDRVSVEIARGCTEGCRFCQAGMIYRPVRERTPQDIMSSLEASLMGGGYDEASLTSLSTADYSAIAPLIHEVMKKLEPQKVSLSVSSLRAYGLDDELLEDIEKVRATGLTFAPEAGSQRMRDVINKNITEEQLMQTAERVFSRGWSKMKLYFMIGLPTEEDSDVAGIVQTGARARNIGRSLQKRAPRVTVSVSTFVPKPHTPFQWCAMNGFSEILRKQGILKQTAREENVQLRMHASEGSWVEGFLARGDRSLGQVIETAYKNGARFDSWEEQLKLDVWKAALHEHQINPDIFLGTIPIDARLPWDHLDVGLEDGFLAREYRKAVANRLSPPCGKVAGMFVHHTNLKDARSDKRKLVCYDCGIACDMQQMRGRREIFLDDLHADKARDVHSVEAKPGSVQRRDTVRKIPLLRSPALRLRLGYTKVGRAAYSAHLDLVRLLPRMARRLDLPLRYSQGFHPKAEMSFGPALSLGVASLGEYVDIKLEPEINIDSQELLERFQDCASEGVSVFSVNVLGKQDLGINKVINKAFYVAGVPRAVLSERELDSEQALQSWIDEKRKTPLEVLRNTKGIKRRVNVAPFLDKVIANQGAETLERAGYMGDLVPIRFSVGITPHGSAKAAEVIEVIFESKDMPARLVRESLVWQQKDRCTSPFDLETLRALSLQNESEPSTVSLG